MAQTLKNESGASLVEISITMIVIAVTTLIIMAFSRNTLKMNRDAKSNDTAVLIAEQKIADLAATTFKVLPLIGSSPTDTVVDNIAYSRNWEVTQSGFIIVAKVTVGWNSGSGQITLAGAVN